MAATLAKQTGRNANNAAGNVNGRFFCIPRNMDKSRPAEKEDLISHISLEFKNPLTKILNNTQILLSNTHRASVLYNNLREIEEATIYCENIVNQLLAFSKMERLNFNPVNINRAMDNSLDFVKYQLKLSNVQVVKHYEENLPSVSGDLQHLEWAFINIMVNSKDAMADGGFLTITTRKINDSVEISFADTGHGIPEDKLDKIFQPFFTTKPRGRGTGLGLSACLGIIEKHRGFIEVKNNPGAGSTFTIILPAQ